jgi:catechol 2,3-dioxygenase-like lactoylglutathione lyase family enzyme
VVTDITTKRPAETRDFYVQVLGFKAHEDLGWACWVVSPDNPTAQIGIFDANSAPELAPDITVEVSDVDAAYKQAQRREARIVLPIRNESWGVRRFFVEDPNGLVINVMTHLPGAN